MTDPAAALATKIAIVHRRLGAAYGLRDWRRHADPVDELVAAMLSQATSDANTEQTFRALRTSYPTWAEVLNAPAEELTEVIRSGGLANQKAPRIQNALRRVQQERGAFDLEWLAALPVAQARAWLTQLKGVGNKTASIVLLFSLGRPAFPVDTHVQRVCRRLGLAPASATADQVMQVLEDHAPAAWFYPLHMNFIQHGRQVCKPRRPLCAGCVLNDVCDWYRGQEGGTSGR